MTEPDYVPYLTRAEGHLRSVYPCMAARQYKQAAQHAYQTVSELMAFLLWITQEKGRG